MAARTKTIWNGTRAEALQLLDIISSNCACEFDALKVRRSTCSVHRILTEEQRTLDGLLFARHMAERLLVEEFLIEEATPAC